MGKDNGNGAYQELDPSLKIVECPCKNKVYTIIVEPRIKDGAARISSLVCTACNHMVQVDGDAIVGEKKKVYVDSLGRNHYRLNVDGGIFGGN